MPVINKSQEDNLKSMLKYAGTAGAAATAIVGIITYILPATQPIAQHLNTLILLTINAVLVLWWKK